MTADASHPLIEREPLVGGFVDRLREVGLRRYHHQHPFNTLMHAGRLVGEDLRMWAANRYYYQTRIPVKDAIIVSKSADPAFRRVWVQRVLDQDGRGDPRGSNADAGGLELWLRLGQAVGLSRELLTSHRTVLPEVRRACDEYVALVRRSGLVVAVAASLTELFAGSLMRTRIDAWKRHYPYVAAEALGYFEERVSRAAQDATFAVEFVQRHATTAKDQKRCLEAFEQKCSILWRLLDSVYMASRWKLRPRLVARAALYPSRGEDGQAMLVAPEKVLALNDTADCVLTRATGDKALSQIVEEVSFEYAVGREEVVRDVATFLGQLEVKRLLRFDTQSPTGEHA